MTNDPTGIDAATAALDNVLLTIGPPYASATSAQLRQAQQDLAASQADLTTALAERDEAKAIGRLLLDELEQLREARDWDVATGYAHDCGFCRWSIQRGEAFKPMPGAKGTFIHIRCPKRETT